MNNKTKKQLTILLSIMPVFLVSLYVGFSYANQDGNAAETKSVEIMVYKSPTCGCCKKWVKYLEQEGFNVKTKNMQNVQPVKNKFGVQRQYQSCHTAKVGNYFIEGHVPASEIKKLLKEQPNIKGLAVPGMPMGSPGMEGHRKDNYYVLAIDKRNNASSYAQY